MQTFTTPGLTTVEDPIKSRHDIKTTRETVKQLLANGTPDWVRFPHDYKAFVKESFAAEKEQSDAQVAQYKMEDQELLTDAAPRMVNIMRSRDFIKKLRDNGVKCFTLYNWQPGLPLWLQQTVGLWACPPFSDTMRYICYLQIPYMWEWSVLRLDRHGLPNGEDYRGWRTAVCELIKKEIFTETKAHEVFGQPTESIVSRRYRKTLYLLRNHKRSEAAPTLG
jgi:hypothetical protein